MSPTDDWQGRQPSDLEGALMLGWMYGQGARFPRAGDSGQAATA